MGRHTYKSAAKSIGAILSATIFCMEWSFNPGRVEYLNGWTIGRAKLCYDELSTALTEIEMIVNSRPLSYVSTEDMEEPLTPLLVGRRTLSLPDVTLHKIDEGDYNAELTPNTLNRRMNHLRKTLDHFWKWWQREYLLQLKDCHCHYKKTDDRGDTLSEVQIVLVHSDKHMRGFWKLGKVQKLIQGSDGHVRGATHCLKFRLF